MKITKKQLKRLIREESAKIIVERGTGNPSLRAEEQLLTRAVADFADKYMLTMGMNPSDPDDMKRTRRTIDDLIGAIMDVL